MNNKRFRTIHKFCLAAGLVLAAPRPGRVGEETSPAAASDIAAEVTSSTTAPYRTGAEKLPLSPPVTMPDGVEFVTWENRTDYTRTFIVDQNHPLASDLNPGTADKPFRTINRAAQILSAGERVLIKSGIYREQVVPRAGGNGPESMISYQAAPGAEVVLKGSKIVRSEWVRSRNPGHFSEKLWMTVLPDSLFPEVSPFTLENASAADIEIMPWAREWSGRVPYTLRRGLVFQDGRRLVQLAVYEDLVRLPGSFWVDSTGCVLHVHPFDGIDPDRALWEVTVRGILFKPEKTDLGYVQVRGLTFAHAGNGFPRTGVGALFTMGGHHWIIEDNCFHDINSVAVEVGARSLEVRDRGLGRKDSERARKSPGSVIVRGNVIFDCGTGGIQGYVNSNALVENNHIFNIGFQDVERYWECAAIKLLVTRRTLVRCNLIHDVEAAMAIWLDWDNRYSRITRNTVYDIEMCCNGALFVEASQFPNMIDNNIVRDIHGVAIYGGDSDSLIIAHNLIESCTGTGIHALVITGRRLNGRPLSSRHHLIANNIICTREAISLQDPDNVSDHNLFCAGFDLLQWRKRGFDRSSRAAAFESHLDRGKVQLRLHSDTVISQFDPVRYCDFDFFGFGRGGRATAGPFHDRFAKPVVLDIDPR